MPPIRPLTRLFWAITAGLAGITALLIALLPSGPGWLAGLTLWLFFTLLTAGLLLLAHRTLGHRNPNLFTGVTLGGSMLKLFACLIFLLIYRKLAQPDNRSYLVVFFVLYTGYTILEILVLQGLVRQEASRRTKDAAGEAG